MGGVLGKRLNDSKTTGILNLCSELKAKDYAEIPADILQAMLSVSKTLTKMTLCHNGLVKIPKTLGNFTKLEGSFFV
jgi:hypothetical protein